MFIFIITLNGLRSLASVIRQENEIVVVNDEDDERKLSLCKMIKFHEGL